MHNIKFDFNDISLIPSTLSDIRSRSEVDIYYNDKWFGKHLPLIVSPMDTVIDSNSLKHFWSSNMLTCSIRQFKPSFNAQYHFTALSFEQFYALQNRAPLNALGILIDIANGHMIDLYNAVKAFKLINPNFPLMIGNIANPKTFDEYCKILNNNDFLRCGIGGGSACTTSANTSIHYPMASLIKECYDESCKYTNPPNIVADGGFKNFDDIIKALNLGADYVMLGGILAKTLEACGTVYWKRFNVSKYKTWFYNKGFNLKRKYRGMSTKEVQRTLNKTNLKTAEGISYWTDVEYKLNGWIDNFNSYLKSAMSYCGKRKLKEFVGSNTTIFISQQAHKRYNK